MVAGQDNPLNLLFNAYDLTNVRNQPTEPPEEEEPELEPRPRGPRPGRGR